MRHRAGAVAISCEPRDQDLAQREEERLGQHAHEVGPGVAGEDRRKLVAPLESLKGRSI
ncbi:MAG: hypothetical protein ACRDL8_06690 [Solirubrobacteraceae bacterium]